MNNKLDIWAVWPTVNIDRSKAKIAIWKKLGYKIGILVNPPHTNEELLEADRVIVQEQWTGFPDAANLLCAEVPGDIVVVVGDDVFPDKTISAQEIGQDFIKHFPDLYGVMQPTGDKYGCWKSCAVSPWIGRTFINKAYEGLGPYWPEYYHYFCDEELQAYAELNCAFYQREDIIQYHDHWDRKPGAKRPKYLYTAKTTWPEDRWLYKLRSKKGFPCQFKA